MKFLSLLTTGYWPFRLKVLNFCDFWIRELVTPSHSVRTISPAITERPRPTAEIFFRGQKISSFCETPKWILWHQKLSLLIFVKFSVAKFLKFTYYSYRLLELIISRYSSINGLKKKFFLTLRWNKRGAIYNINSYCTI